MSTDGGAVGSGPLFARGRRPLGPLALTPAELVLLGACFLLALGLVLHDLAQPTGLYGVTEYDDGVYFASALRLSEGFVPYKDFVLLQPPGIAVLLAPLGFLAHLVGDRDALAVARGLTGVVAGLNAALVCFLLRHRGLFAAGLGGALMALFPPAWAADHTLMLEPWLVLCCLLGTALCFSGEHPASRRRVVLGGLFFGLAGAVKAWAVVPVALLFVVLLLARRERALPYAAGVAAAFLLICLPFFALAPHQFTTDVITSQLARATVAPTTLNVRLAAYTGLTSATGALARHLYGPDSPWPDLAAALLGATLLLGSLVPLSRRRGSALEAFLLAAAGGTVAMTFVPEQFFTHYAYFTAPFLAAGVGCCGGRVATAFSRMLRSRPARPALLLSVCGGLLLVLLVALVLPGELAADRYLMKEKGDPGPSIAAEIPKGACVLTDALSVTISANRADASGSCPAIVDPTGIWISDDPQNPPQRLDHHPPPAVLVRAWEGYFSAAQYVVLSGGLTTLRIPFRHTALLGWFEAHYHRLEPGGIAIYVRDGL